MMIDDGEVNEEENEKVFDGRRKVKNDEVSLNVEAVKLSCPFADRFRLGAIQEGSSSGDLVRGSRR